MKLNHNKYFLYLRKIFKNRYYLCQETYKLITKDEKIIIHDGS